MSTQNKTKLSLITVCFNSQATIEKTLASVLTQSYENIEYIVIDGNSSDNTLNILEQYHEGIDILVSEEDKGLYDAMNKGIARATGEVIAFINSDDVFENDNSVDLLMAPFSDPCVDCVYSDLVYINRKNNIVRYWRSCPFVKGAFGKGWLPAHPTFYARRKVYHQLGGFNCDLRFGNDVDLMMRFLEKGKIKSVYMPRVSIRMLIGGVSNRSIKTIWIQNTSTIKLMRAYEIDCNVLFYVVGKLSSRIAQLFVRPKWEQ